MNRSIITSGLISFFAMTINLTYRKCPVCQESLNSEPSVLPDINPEHNIDIIKKYWRGFYKQKIFFPYYRCKCGFLYNQKFFDKESLNQLYSDMGDNVHSGDIKLDIKTKKKYLEQIKNNFPFKHKNIKVLEIGGDNGSFSKLIKDTNFVHSISVVEPNQRMHGFLKLVTPLIYSHIEEIPIEAKFDLIIAIHVVEHIPEIDIYINELSKHLNKEGCIYGVAHNEKSTITKVLKNRWPSYNLQHPHLFNFSTINLFFKRLKYKKLFIKKTKNYFSIGYLLKQLSIAILKKEINFPNLFSIGLKLGNFSFLYKKEVE